MDLYTAETQPGGKTSIEVICINSFLISAYPEV